MRLAFIQPGDPARFPDPRTADGDGLVAVGGDLLPGRLIVGYERGIFPWSDDESPLLWWCPDPRAVLVPERVHVSRSLRRELSRARFRVTWNQAFDQVIRACGEDREEGTWITRSMRSAYGVLHDLGRAHSLEVWDADDLVGGIYGVQVGGVFAAESMFHRRTNASKVALVTLARSLAARGVDLIDVQFLTPHLKSMGGEEWPREQYLDVLERLRGKDVDLSGCLSAS